MVLAKERNARVRHRATATAVLSVPVLTFAVALVWFIRGPLLRVRHEASCCCLARSAGRKVAVAPLAVPTARAAQTDRRGNPHPVRAGPSRTPPRTAINSYARGDQVSLADAPQRVGQLRGRLRRHVRRDEIAQRVVGEGVRGAGQQSCARRGVLLGSSVAHHRQCGVGELGTHRPDLGALAATIATTPAGRGTTGQGSHRRGGPAPAATPVDAENVVTAPDRYYSVQGGRVLNPAPVPERGRTRRPRPATRQLLLHGG